MKYKIADFIIEYEATYNRTESRSKKYSVNEDEREEYYMFVNDEHIKKMMKKDPSMTKELAEYMLFGNTFYKELINHNGCLLHASTVVVDDEAYLFSANCGTGKSTHTGLWLKYLADKKPYILNDDKPAIRIMDDGIFAYGTPFSGKHDISENKKVKIKGICFIEQSKTNFIRKVETKEAISLFFEQTYTYLNEVEMNKLFDIIEIILKEIPVYKLYCDMSEEAVQLSYRTMKGENTDEN